MIVFVLDDSFRTRLGTLAKPDFTEINRRKKPDPAGAREIKKERSKGDNGRQNWDNRGIKGRSEGDLFTAGKKS